MKIVRASRPLAVILAMCFFIMPQYKAYSSPVEGILILAFYAPYAIVWGAAMAVVRAKSAFSDSSTSEKEPPKSDYDKLESLLSNIECQPEADKKPETVLEPTPEPDKKPDPVPEAKPNPPPDPYAGNSWERDFDNTANQFYGDGGPSAKK